MQPNTLQLGGASSIRDFLAACGLSAYTDALTEAGLDSFEFLLALTEAELADAAMGVGMKPLHIKKLVSQRRLLSSPAAASAPSYSTRAVPPPEMTAEPMTPVAAQMSAPLANPGSLHHHLVAARAWETRGRTDVGGSLPAAVSRTPSHSPMQPASRLVRGVPAAAGDLFGQPMLNYMTSAEPAANAPQWRLGRVLSAPLVGQVCLGQPLLGQAAAVFPQQLSRLASGPITFEGQPPSQPQQQMVWLPVPQLPSPGQALVLVSPPTSPTALGHEYTESDGSPTGGGFDGFADLQADELPPEAYEGYAGRQLFLEALHLDMIDAEQPPPPSEGSVFHGTGRCNPCGWHWKPQGCQHGQKCHYCHLCPEGEIKRRKKERSDALRKAHRSGSRDFSKQQGPRGSPGAAEGW